VVPLLRAKGRRVFCLAFTSWPFVEPKTGHDAMVSAPQGTARLLLAYA